MNRKTSAAVIAASICLVIAAVSAYQAPKAGQNYTIAVYYWPNFHPDPFHQAKLGKGWTEWKLMKLGKPQFPGHYQPKVPLWGERDESDPKQMARSIDAMADAGINAIIFDWYRYDDDINGGVMIEGALRKGFLKAPNRGRVKFALMWANHNYVNCYPFKPGESFAEGKNELWRHGPVSRAAFDRHMNDAAKTYFTQPNYWKIDGRPYFSIYELQNLIRGLGGLKQTREALDAFRQRLKSAGFPGLHLNVIVYQDFKAFDMVKGAPMPDDPSRKVETPADLLKALKVDSVTWYQWVHHVEPKGDYVPYGNRALLLWDGQSTRYGVPFFPHVSVGWDGTPRNYGTGIVTNNTPENYEMFLRKAKEWLAKHPESRGILTLNSWNEWVEGSYLEPDKVYGTRYLDAVRHVFVK